MNNQIIQVPLYQDHQVKENAFPYNKNDVLIKIIDQNRGMGNLYPTTKGVNGSKPTHTYKGKRNFFTENLHV